MNGLEFKDFFTQMSKEHGAFEDHISKSIPGYKQMAYATADIVGSIINPDDHILDIGSSEGYWGDAVIKRSPRALVASLDPNPEMGEVFRRNHWLPSNNMFLPWAFGDGFFDGERRIPGYQPHNMYRVVRESMTFQFIDKDRAYQYYLVRQALTEGGIFITNSKTFMSNCEEYDKYESLKDKYKQQFFTEEQLRLKATTVLPNMGEHMVSLKQTIIALQRNFKYVLPYWTSGNFHGFVASNKTTLFNDFRNLSNQFEYTDSIPGRSIE